MPHRYVALALIVGCKYRAQKRIFASVSNCVKFYLNINAERELITPDEALWCSCGAAVVQLWCSCGAAVVQLWSSSSTQLLYAYFKTSLYSI